jgi:hypothetical protein
MEAQSSTVPFDSESVKITNLKYKKSNDEAKIKPKIKIVKIAKPKVLPKHIFKLHNTVIKPVDQSYAIQQAKLNGVLKRYNEANKQFNKEILNIINAQKTSCKGVLKSVKSNITN